MSQQQADQNPVISYFEEKSNGLSIISSNIKADSCVLVLGPLFGINKDKKVIYDEIKKYLLQEDDSLIFDHEFQNLFLIEKNYEATIIEEMIVSSYEKFSREDKPCDSYDKISKIKFTTVINFGQDTFLVDELKKNQIKYQFSYFSICKTLSEYVSVSKEAEYKKFPFIFNMFGHYQHRASLIYNYDRFYKFFFSALGDTNEFPDEVKNRLAQARIFILLGFDLKKWYVPIFITKLCKVGRENTESRPMVLAALNDTDKDNQPYVNWLTRFPLNLQFIRDSHQFVDLLTKTPSNLNSSDSVNSGVTSLENIPTDLLDKEKHAYRKRVDDCVFPDEILDIIDELKTTYETKKYKEGIACMGNFRLEMKKSLNLFYVDEISEEEKDRKVAVVRRNLLSYLQ
jgi:hypothetical protein